MNEDIPEEDLPEWYAKYEQKANEKALEQSKINPDYNLAAYEALMKMEKVFYVTVAESVLKNEEITQIMRDEGVFEDASNIVAHITNMINVTAQGRFPTDALLTLMIKAMKWSFLKGYEAKDPPSMFEEFIDNIGDERRE